MVLWLGMAKAGVCTALVNVHIKGPPLVHAIRTALDQSKRRVVVVDRSLADCVVCPDVLAELSAKVGFLTLADRNFDSMQAGGSMVAFRRIFNIVCVKRDGRSIQSRCVLVRK